MAKNQRTVEELEALKPKYFEAIDAGLSTTAAAAAVGIHVQTGQRWQELRETGDKEWVVRARERREEMVAYSYKHGVAAAAKKYKTTESSVYSARYAVRQAKGELGNPPPRAPATNGHAPAPVAPKKAQAQRPAPAEPVEVSTVTTSTAFSATMKVMQILEPLAEADRARVAKAVLQFVQGGIG